jgi:hypothetical protein
VLSNQSKRDDIGIGGSWSDFLDYLKSSLSSGEVKLLFAADQLRKSPGMITEQDSLVTNPGSLVTGFY